MLRLLESILKSLYQKVRSCVYSVIQNCFEPFCWVEFQKFKKQSKKTLWSFKTFKLVRFRIAMQSAFQPQIILLREGTDTSQGKSQIIANINACEAIADTVRTTLGPLGMDKLIFSSQKTTISNDGATIMKLLDIIHPAAKTLVDISMSQVIFQIKYVFH